MLKMYDVHKYKCNKGGFAGDEKRYPANYLLYINKCNAAFDK